MIRAAFAALALLASGTIAAAEQPSSPLQALGAPLSAEALGGTRARGANDTPLAGNLGSLTGNSADGSVTGSITNQNSIAGNAGITTVFQNTGNNVMFQNATSLNVTIR